MTRIEAARAGTITDEMRAAAAAGSVDPEGVRAGLADGTLVLVRNRLRAIPPLPIGRGFSTKVNANVGSSGDVLDPEGEVRKAEAAVAAGADAVMDLSTGGDLGAIRAAIIDRARVAIGTVPIYQAVRTAVSRQKSILDLSADELFEVIERQCEEGVDFITVHCGVTRATHARMRAQGRLCGVVSRGGAMTVEWMKRNRAENPLFEQYDRLLAIARRHDVTLSLGDGFRPGAVADATDRAQIDELVTLGELAARALSAGVQAMIEGPGHVPLHQVAENIRIQKSLCRGAPFYVLGPLVTDVAPGYDHITAAIGGALAGMAGADFLCYVTPSEHLRLPDLEDVRQGVIASRIAAHAADIAKGLPGAIEWDIRMSKARAALDWEGQIREAIDPARARALRASSSPADGDVCTMCGEYCAIKIQRQKRDG